MPERPGFSVSFWGMVTGVMVALKLKDSWDDYKQVSTEAEEDGRIALVDGEPPVYRDAEGGNEEAISLLNTDIPVTRPKRKRAQCCVCCGLNCGLFWKAFGIVVAIFALWNAFKLIQWAITPSPTGLEDMPTYSTSLGCVAAQYTYAGKPTSFNVPLGSENDHAFDTKGGAPGTITVLEGAPSATKVTYEVTVRSDDESLLDGLVLDHSPDQDGGAVQNSHFHLVTPHPAEGQCIRYDVKMYVPPTLKKLALASHTISHVQFDPDSHIQLDEFYVTLFSSKRQNLILPHNNLRSHKMTLEVFEGWIVGDVSIDSTTKITSQRGGGVINVRVHPTLAVDPASPEVATFRTTSGSGRTDIFYVDHDAHVHRPISSTHMSSMNADMYLTYRDAQYSGLIELAAKSYTATGVQKINSTGEESQGKWTHWVGDEEGKDELSIKTRGWVGVYF